MYGIKYEAATYNLENGKTQNFEEGRLVLVLNQEDTGAVETFATLEDAKDALDRRASELALEGWQVERRYDSYSAEKIC